MLATPIKNNEHTGHRILYAFVIEVIVNIEIKNQKEKQYLIKPNLY